MARRKQKMVLADTHRQSIQFAPAVIRPRKKIGILGTTPSRLQAPIRDAEWELWTIGPGGKDAHRWDRLYEVHHTWPANFDGYLQDLSVVKPPQEVWTLRPAAELIAEWRQDHGPEATDGKVTGDWASNKVVDRDKIHARFFHFAWFSSSISWCIGQALLEHWNAFDRLTLGFWGIDLESGEEYLSQWIGALHLIDVARTLGVDVVMPKGCGLDRDVKPYPDRCETNLALTFEKKAQWLDQTLGQLEPQFEALRAEAYRTEGAIACMRANNAPANLIEPGEKKLMDLNAQLGNAAMQINRLKGEASATAFYRSRYVWSTQDPG